MKKELQEKIFNRFPHLYREKNLPKNESCMYYGLTVDDGWFDLIWKLSEDIEKELAKDDKFKEAFAVMQVKEKFGGLRYYISGGNAKIDTLIGHAESLSFSLCEACGCIGKMRRSSGWMHVACDECEKKR